MEKIYEDDTVYLTNEIIGIKKYFFPFANEKDITYDDIADVHLRTDYQASQEWGLHPKDQTKWFNKDPQRQFKPNYIELTLKDQQTKPCFSPENCEIVYKIIASQISKIAGKNKPKQSQLDLKTEGITFQQSQH